MKLSIDYLLLSALLVISIEREEITLKSIIAFKVEIQLIIAGSRTRRRFFINRLPE